MRALTATIAAIDRFTDTIGKLVSWCAVIMVLVTCYIAVTRYVLNEGSIAVQESVTYFNALLFMLSAGFTLLHNGHVRVDIFYGHASPRYRAWVDLLGSIFLLMPVCVFIFWVSWDYVMASWRIMEGSAEPGGLPYVYLLKSLILAMSALLILQGAAEILRSFSSLFLSSHAKEFTRTAPEDEGTIL